MPRYIWPVPREASINQLFGADPESIYNPPGGHTGMDFGVKAGTPLYAPAAGFIEYAQWFTTDSGSDNPYWITNGGGITVVLGCDGDDAPSFVFSHLDYTDLNPGDHVQQGDVIGYSGNTGKWTTGAHLHFEAIPPGFNLHTPTYGRVDPARYCAGHLSTITGQGSGAITPIQEDELSNDQVERIINEVNAANEAKHKVTREAIAAVAGQVVDRRFPRIGTNGKAGGEATISSVLGAHDANVVLTRGVVTGAAEAVAKTVAAINPGAGIDPEEQGRRAAAAFLAEVEGLKLTITTAEVTK